MEHVYDQVNLVMILLKSVGGSFSLQEPFISLTIAQSFYLNGEELQDLDAFSVH
jgi:hypothetical protein